MQNILGSLHIFNLTVHYFGKANYSFSFSHTVLETYKHSEVSCASGVLKV